MLFEKLPKNQLVREFYLAELEIRTTLAKAEKRPIFFGKYRNPDDEEEIYRRILERFIERINP